jgi:flavin reductase (DIM6/NTAB) family NADH-FMN oxidoreductase RutF
MPAARRRFARRCLADDEEPITRIRYPETLTIVHGAQLAMSSYLEFDPSIIDKRQVYRLLTGGVVPRPIGWASTINGKGIANLAPFSFFTVVCVIPPMVSLTVARNPDGSEKHTLKNIRDNGEFCVNVVTRPVWKEMVDSANAIPEDDSEFTATGLTPIACVKIKPPRVKEVPIHFECKLHQIIELGPNRHPLVIGEVVYFHVDSACMTNGYIDMKKLDPIGRLNGFFYMTLGEIYHREFEDGQPR